MILQKYGYLVIPMVTAAVLGSFGSPTRSTTNEKGTRAVIDWGPERNGARCAVALPADKLNEVPAGEPVDVILHTKNFGKAPVTVITEVPLLEAFAVKMIGPDGERVRFTSFGEKLNSQSSKSLSTQTLNPDEEDKTKLPLSRIYDMTRSGEYKISFSRMVGTRAGNEQPVTSNVLTLTVVEPKK